VNSPKRLLAVDRIIAQQFGVDAMQEAVEVL
jgi:hypothetical protein